MMTFHIFGVFFLSIIFLSMSTGTENPKNMNAVIARQKIGQYLIRQAVSATFSYTDCQTVNCIDSVIKKWYCEEKILTTTTTTTTTTETPTEEVPMEFPTEGPTTTSTISVTENSSTLQTTNETSVNTEKPVHHLQVTFTNVKP